MAKGNANTEFVRIRMTPALKEAFLEHGEIHNLSEASVARVAIYDLVAKGFKKRTGKTLEKPEVQPNNWTKEKGK